jgi:hypothetical protein
MAKIIDYTVADGVNGAQLIASVQKLIAEGWQPLGGMVLAIDPDYTGPQEDGEGVPKFNLGQAMVRYESTIKLVN